jgi:hypothetical protein
MLRPARREFQMSSIMRSDRLTTITRSKARVSCCAMCGGRFGLIRYRLGIGQFSSKRCLNSCGRYERSWSLANAFGLVPEQREQNDERQRHAEQPQTYGARGLSTRPSQVPSRSAPPSAAARLAANAPANSAAVSQNDRCAAPRRVRSASSLASFTT